MKPVAIFNSLKGKPLGKWLFSKLVCFQAPYFSSVNPRIELLEPKQCVVTIKDKKRVRNHLKSIHAIAMCNMAELSAGMMTDASIPKGARWIPTGMSVNYVKKARGPLTATANGQSIDWQAAESKEVPVSIIDSAGDEVFNAKINMSVKLAS